jgi:hypothetical protein
LIDSAYRRVALKVTNINWGNDKVMRERRRVEILHDRLAAQGFLSIVDLMAAMVFDAKACVTEAP